MNRSSDFFRALFTAMLLLTTLAPVDAPTQTYRLTDLGVPAGRQLTHPAAINIQGWVAGSSELQAFRYINGVMQELGTLAGATVSSGAAINSSGEVAGSATFQNGATFGTPPSSCKTATSISAPCRTATTASPPALTTFRKWWASLGLTSAYYRIVLLP